MKTEEPYTESNEIQMLIIIGVGCILVQALKPDNLDWGFVSGFFPIALLPHVTFERGLCNLDKDQGLCIKKMKLVRELS